MKIVIDIPEKTNAHIRSDYGHGIKGFRNADREILCDAIYHGTPYEERLHGHWVYGKCIDGNEYCHCSECSVFAQYDSYGNYKASDWCPNCGADMRKKEGEKK
jgi:hypothetical protein